MSKAARSVIFLGVTLLYIGVTATDATAMSVEEAYKAIPHARTAFDAGTSKLTTRQASALKHLFDHADRGIVLRMEGLRAIQDNKRESLQSTLTSYRALTSSLAALSTPAEIKPAQELILQSIRLHQNYFETILRNAESSGKYDAAFSQDIYSSSQKLQMAYAVLMQAFPSETTVNRQAFYDYLCALDFR